jgi:hypothetical protein
MIVVFDGQAGTGKTWLMTRTIYKNWLYGLPCHLNYRVYFDNYNENVSRWHNLDEVYHLQNGIIGIDEGQKLFDARRWASLPLSFAEKIASHRHHHLDIYTTTQDLLHIDLRVRSNIHELYSCRSVFRWPKDDRNKPIIYIMRVTKKVRRVNADTNRLTFDKVGTKTYYLSRFWTKTLYDTYANIDFQRLLCKLKREKKAWTGKIYSRDLVNRGKARL